MSRRILLVVFSIPALCAISFFLVGFVLKVCPEPIGSRADIFLEGARTTLILTLSAGAMGILVGVAAALAKLGPSLLLKGLANGYIWIFRGTPLLTQILFVYYAVPVLFPFLQLNELTGALIALSLNVGAYNAEAIRAGILSVPRGQTEAARCLGFSRFQISRLIVLPQAIPVMTPPLVNNLVALLKDSAMASSIGLLELTLAGTRISSETFLPVPVLTTVALVYLFLTTIVGFISQLVMFGAVRIDWFLEGEPK